MKTSTVLFGLFAATSALVYPRASSNFTVALVRSPPANYPYPPPLDDWNGEQHDLDATVRMGLELIKRASQNGANLVAFPELWFPGYYSPKTDGPSKFLNNYIDQALTVESANWKRLVAAAKQHHIWVSFGFSQKIGDHIFMAQALIDDKGKVIQVRQKLRPSGGERTVFSDGTIDHFIVHQTPFGRLGMLECWEHMHPTMTFAMQAQNENLHIASFPWAPDLGAMSGYESTENSITGARYYAITGGAYVFMPAVGTAAVIHPNGTTLAQVDASDCPLAKPILYHSVNTSTFAGTKSYNLDGEFSWAALQQINDAYPKYIPKKEGNFIRRQLNSVTQMKKTGPVKLRY
ncbi:hypothetical protein FSARC_940 [Fusarium sarcochroum]|uniref:nitrilase n=1 Tax=Fusarium sarcochroum TaxID=1208366 RepID=A0A8H4U9V0_9HYPO|nr:hypothetical protein FSARC_940 [Fusarium sarcochroum]